MRRALSWISMRQRSDKLLAAVVLGSLALLALLWLRPWRGAAPRGGLADSDARAARDRPAPEPVKLVEESPASARDPRAPSAVEAQEESAPGESVPLRGRLSLDGTPMDGGWVVVRSAD